MARRRGQEKATKRVERPWGAEEQLFVGSPVFGDVAHEAVADGADEVRVGR